MDNEHNEEFIKNLADDYKEVLMEKDRKLKFLARKHNVIFKILCIVYSIFKQMDIALHKIEYPLNSIFSALHSMVEFGRAEVSETIHLYLPEESDSENE